MGILIIGASGFLGKYVVNIFLQKNVSIYILERQENEIQNKCKNKKYFVKVDELQALIESNQIKTIVFLANRYDRNNPILDVLDCNIGYLIKCLEIIKITRKNVHFIYSGSIAKSESSFYGATKNAATEFLKFYATNHIKITNVIIHQMYGPNDTSNSYISSAIRQIIEGRTIYCMDSGQKRDFIHVSDVASAISIISDHGFSSDFCSYDLGTGIPTTLRSFFTTVREHSRHPTLSDQFLYKPDYSRRPRRAKANNSTLLRLGWVPKINLENGVRQLIDSWISK